MNKLLICWVHLLVATVCGCQRIANKVTMPKAELMMVKDSSRCNATTLLSQGALLIIFLSPSCSFCDRQVANITYTLNTFNGTVCFIFAGTDFETGQFVIKHKLSRYPRFMIARDYKGDFAKSLRIREVPVVLLFDRFGILSQRLAGTEISNELQSSIDQAY